MSLPAGPEASESTVEENEDDIQFVSVSSSGIWVFPSQRLCRTSRDVISLACLPRCDFPRLFTRRPANVWTSHPDWTVWSRAQEWVSDWTPWNRAQEWVSEWTAWSRAQEWVSVCTRCSRMQERVSVWTPWSRAQEWVSDETLWSRAQERVLDWTLCSKTQE